MWHALNQQRVLSVFTTDVTPAAIDLMCAFYPTIPRREISARILSTPFKKGEPYVLFGAKGGRVSAEVGYILIPPEFILKALQDPVEVLASIVFIGSQVRDFANNRLQTRADTSQQVLSRAEYYEAHFLAEAAARNPSVVFSPNAILLRKKFPEGLLAPQIPNWVIYTSAQGNNPQNAGQN